MNKMKKFLQILFLLCPFLVRAQEIQFSDPVPLGSSINSESEEVSALLSPNGKTLYFVRAFDSRNKGGIGAGMDIWTSQRDSKGRYLPASNEFKQWNNRFNNSIIGIRKDNQVVYLLNSYNNKPGIAFSKYLGGEWTSPELIPIPGIQQLNLVGFYMHSSFSILLISIERPDSQGKEDLYVSLKDSLEHWSEPLNLGTTINTPGFEISPFLSEDGKRLYFSSDGHQGYGDADIFVAERLYNNWTLWTRPKNLGSKINSEKFDAYFSIYGDTICYFSSNQASNFSDIYSSRVSLGKRTLLRDSVNKIVNETKKLLSDLKSSDEPDGFQYVVSPLNSVVLSSLMQTQIKKLVTQYQTDKIQVVELICYRLHPDQRTNIIDYLKSLGIAPKKIKPPTLVGSGTTQSGVEIKVFLEAKK
jgi:hypothetical protein